MHAEVLPGPDRAENHDARVETSLRDGQPRRGRRPTGLPEVMRLTQHEDSGTWVRLNGIGYGGGRANRIGPARGGRRFDWPAEEAEQATPHRAAS